VDPILKGKTPVATAEFGCQTEYEEASPTPIQITPQAPKSTDFGVQVELKSMVDTEIRTDVPAPSPELIVEHAEVGIQHEPIESALLPIFLQAEVQTTSVKIAQTEVQTLPVSVPEKVDVETQTVHLSELDSDDDTILDTISRSASSMEDYKSMQTPSNKDEEDVDTISRSVSMEDYESMQTLSDEDGDDDDDTDMFQESHYSRSPLNP